MPCVRRPIARTRLLESPAGETDPQSLRRAILADARHEAESAASPALPQGDQRHRHHPAHGLGPGRASRQGHAANRQPSCPATRLLQVDIDSGQRSRRDGRIEWLLQQLTGAEAATVVNNNAAATSIVLNTVACGNEVIVSRGQLVEIGGSFRLPDVMAASGAKLVEVGTTNKTHARDYENAITAEHGRHPSRASEQLQDFRVHGRSAAGRVGAHRPRSAESSLIDDVGAGPLVDFSRFGFDKEPTLQESVQAGADLITCQRRQAHRRQPRRASFSAGPT